MALPAVAVCSLGGTISATQTGGRGVEPSLTSEALVEDVPKIAEVAEVTAKSFRHNECLATDKAGNLASSSFKVTVQDTTNPTLDLPKNITLKAAGPTRALAAFTSTASDTVDGNNVPVSCSPASGNTFPTGETPVNCSAEDGAGNEATGSFKVSVTQTKVTLDIKPQTCPNALSTSDSGSYPVAIVGMGGLDVSSISVVHQRSNRGQ